MEKIDPKLNEANLVAAAAAKQNAEDARTRAFRGGSVYDYPFEEKPDTVLGSPENVNYVARFNNSPETRKYVEAIDRAFAAKDKFNEEASRYESAATTPVAGSPFTVGMSYAIKRPQMHPYVAWLTSRGNNRQEVISTIARDGDRAKFIFERLKNAGVMESLYSPGNIELLNYPDTALADWLRENGHLKNEEELKFFVQNANNKYSRHFSTSVFDLMWQKAGEDGKVKSFMPMTLRMRMANGYRVKPHSHKDFEMYKQAVEMESNNEWDEVLARGFEALGHLASAFTGSFYETGVAMVTPEWEFENDWATERNLSAEDIKLKRDFLNEYGTLIKMYREGSIYAGDIDTTLLKYAANNDIDAMSMDAAEWTILDPTASKAGNNEQVQKVMFLWRQLDKKGALKNDIRGLNALASNIDGIFNATAGWLTLVSAEDPKSWINSAMGAGYATYFELFSDEKMSGSVYDAIIRGKMRYSNYSADWNELHRSWMTNGSITRLLPDSWSEQVRDKKIIENTSQWADVFVASALTRGIGKAMFRGAGGEVVSATRAGMARDAAATADKALINEIARKSVEIPAGGSELINEVMQAELAKGNTIDVYKAIQMVFDGTAEIQNKAGGGIIKVDRAAADALRRGIVDRLNNVNAARRQMAAVVKESRKVVYSEQANETIQRLRDILNRLEPNLGWDKASNVEIYARARVGIKGMEALPDALKIPQSRMQAFFKEVGTSWRRFDKSDLAGWERFESIEAWGRARDIAPRIRNAANSLYVVRDWIAKTFGSYRDMGGPTSADVGNLVRAGSEVEMGANMNLAQTGGSSSAYRSYNEARKLTGLASWVGFAAVASDLWADYEIITGKQAVGLSTQSMKRLKQFYTKQLDDLFVKKANIEKSLGVSTTKEELAAIIEEIDRVSSKRNFAGYASAWFGSGMLSGIGQFANGAWGAVSNEWMLWLSDTTLVGTAAGYSMGYKGLNLMTRSFYRNFDATYGVNERLTTDLAELGMRMSEMDSGQRAALASTISALVEMRDGMKGKPGLGVLQKHPGVNADLWFAQTISQLARMYNVHGDFQLHDSGTITASVGFFYDAELVNNPELATKMRDILIREANEKNLRGEEAIQYAEQILQAHRNKVIASSRVGSIDIEIAELTERKNSIDKATNGVLTDLHDAGRKLISDLGLDADKFETTPEGNAVFLKQTGQNPDGTPIYQRIDFKPTDQRIIQRLDGFRSAFRDMTNQRLRNNALVLDINEKIARLENDKATLASVAETDLPSFREGMSLTTKEGVRITHKRGVTFFEQPVLDENGNQIITTKILVDKNYLLTLADPSNREPGGVAVLAEELAHSMAMQDVMQTGRVMFQNALFGKWVANEFGEMTMVEPPSVAGDVDKNIALMDQFVNAYALGMDEAARAAYLARWEHGKNMWRTTKSDYRFLMDGILEMMGQVHVQRMMMNNPQSRRGVATGSTIQGGWETSPTLAGNTKFKKFLKFAFGDATLEDVLTEGTTEKAQSLMVAIANETNPERKARMEAELAAAEKEIQAGAALLDRFGMGGFFDKLFNNRMTAMLYAFGLRNNKNDSPDPMAFWKGSIWDERTGKEVPIHPSLVDAVEKGIAASRGQQGRISFNSNIHWQTIQAEENSTTPDAAKRRMIFALATGRRDHIDPKTGKWKKSFKQILDDENRPIDLILKYAAERDEETGDLFGFTPYRSNSGHIKIFGAPNREQAKNILKFLEQAAIEVTPDSQLPELGKGKGKLSREAYQEWWRKFEIGGPYRMNRQTYENTAMVLESIARSDIFDNDNIVNGSAGTLPIFTFEYQGVTTSMGAGTTKQRSARNDLPTLRRGAFFAITVEQSTLDREGDKVIVRSENGDIIGYGEQGEGTKAIGAKPFMYAWFLNVDNLDARIRAGWEGKLVDSNGEVYPWTHAEISHMFSGSAADLGKAVEIVLKNFALGGPYDARRTGGAKFPPKRSWEALLEMNGDNPVAAQRMADVVLRIIGFPDNELNELVRLRNKASNKFTPAEWVMSTAEQQRLAALEKKFSGKEEGIEENRKFFALLNAKHPNEAGAGPMWDIRMAFEKIRLDRIVGPLTQLRNPDGNNSTIAFTPYSRFWGSANFNNALGWTTLSRQQAADATSGFNLQGFSIVEAIKHETGYTAFLLQKPGTKAIYKGSMEWVVYDPKMNKVDGNFEFKTQALDAAEQHNAKNPIDRTASLANQFEKDMVAGGFIPSGQSVWLGKRTEYISQDGFWRVSWNQTRGKWDLYNHTNNLLVSSGISLNALADKGKKGADVGELMAHIKDAVDNNTVEVLLTKREHERLNDLGVMQWRRITNPDGTTTSVRKYNNNKPYWSFKAYLAKIYGKEEANKIAGEMVTQLGDSVVENDPSATLDWIYKWKNSNDFSSILNPEIIERTVSQDNAAERARFAAELGKTLVLKPEKPKPPVKKDGMTVAEWKALQDEFAKLSADYEANRTAEPTFEQMALERQAKVDAFVKMTQWLDRQIADQKKFSEQQKNPPVVPGPSREGVVMSNMYADLLGLIRKAEATTLNEVYTNDFGYLIRSAAIKRPRDPFGIAVETPPLSGRKDLTGLEQAKRNLFYIYNPSGKLIAQAKSFEEASDAANDDAVGTPAGAMRATRVLEAIRNQK